MSEKTVQCLILSNGRFIIGRTAFPKSDDGGFVAIHNAYYIQVVGVDPNSKKTVIGILPVAPWSIDGAMFLKGEAIVGNCEVTKDTLDMYMSEVSSLKIPSPGMQKTLSVAGK